MRAPFDPRWFVLLYEFNRLPVSQLHPSWLATLPHGELLARLREHPRTRRRLSRYLCATLQLDPDFWYEFPEPASRVVLLPMDVLEELTRYLGLCTLTPHIRAIVDRQRVQQIKQCLGEAAYRFALKRVPFLTRNPPQGEPPPTDPSAWGDHALQTGIGLWSALLVQEPVELRHRLALKFPVSAKQLLHQRSPLEAPGMPLIRKLLNEVASPWASFVN